MTDLENRLAMLSPDKRDLLNELLKKRGRTENVFPLAVFQEGMWFLEQLQPNNPAYTGVSALRIRGPLDPGVLADAMNEVTRRHEALRTTFQLRDGKPVQVVHRWAAAQLPAMDLRGAEVGDDDLAEAIEEAVFGRPLAIEAEPSLRMALLRTGDEEYILVTATHHLVSDRQSFGIMISEMAIAYDAFLAGRPSPLPALAIQYGDFSCWQQQQRDSGRWAQDLAYWRQHLAGAPAALTLPTDRPRPAVQGFNGDLYPIELPAQLMDALGALANRRGATVYMALLAVFNVLLHRYSNQDDVVVGSPATIRSQPEIQSLIGYFINTLPIRTKLGGEPSFNQVLDQVRASCLGAYRHQDVPFDMIVADLNVTRDLSRPPVYQVSFTYGREPSPGTAFGGAELTRLPATSRGARFDLELQTFHAGSGGLSGWLEYDTDLFDEATIARMAGHFRQLAEQAVADPEQCIDRMDMLGPSERQRIVAGFNDTGRDWPDEDGWIHQCFEARVQEQPAVEAVRFDGQSLTYQELNRRANQLAWRLMRLGAGRNTLVGVSMERSLELVVALLAIVKAGAAYVPLDPGYPRARLEHMISDAQVPILLTQRRIKDRLPPVRTEVLCVDELEAELTHEPDVNPDLAVDGGDLVYVIYTSGSTGLPKGVMNVHDGIRNRLLWMQDTFRLDSSDRVLQKTPFSFDVSVWEFFWPLMAGATLVVARPEGHKDGAYLARVIRDEAVTTIHFVPSMLQVFLAEPVEDLTSLRWVIVSGEALPRDLQDRFLARSSAELHNLYGPTEAAIDVTHWACRREDGKRSVPIGKPIANTQVYVLDRFLQPVPVGVPGELHLGGRNLARGYLNRNELTAERFIDNPFGPSASARLYKTGDLARFLNDGALEFLGRLDYQVKVRGFRIELGEIEAALADLPQVREAAVVAREHQPGGMRLVAYLTVTGPVPPSVAELAGQLRQRLPDYMVPSSFEMLEKFPLTPNGKIDRKALPEPVSSRPGPASAYLAPEGELEDTLAGLWQEILGVDRVGRHDNFFDLGGHSLLLARFRTELAVRAGHDVPMVELFQHPTISSLAGHLSQPADRPDVDRLQTRERAQARRQSLGRRQRMASRRSGSGSSR